MTGVWQRGAAMVALRSGHTSTLLPSGLVLSAGDGSAELFDPASARSRSLPAPLPRSQHAATLLKDGKVLFTGGDQQTAELYDPEAERFVSTGQQVEVRCDPRAVPLTDGRVLLIGGNDCQSPATWSATSELYDPATGTFTAGPSMARGRPDMSAVRLGSGRVLVSSGTSTEVFDPTADGGAGAFSAGPALVSPGTYGMYPLGTHSATLLKDGRVLLVRGCERLILCDKGAEIVDPDGGAAGVDLPGVLAHRDHTATLLPDGDVLLAGGFKSNPGFTGATPDVWRFDFRQSTRVDVDDLPVGRVDHTAVLLPSGNVALIGGASDPRIDVFTTTALTRSHQLLGPPDGTSPSVHEHSTLLESGEVLFTGSDTAPHAHRFVPSSKTFVGVPMAARRKGHTATTLPDHRVLVVGGSGAESSAELYDSSTNAFAAAASPITPRTGHTATLLPSGSVLIAGGTSEDVAEELYDPSSDAFRATGKMTARRSNHSAVLLKTGEVLLVGGGSAELYDPATEAFRATGSPVGSRSNATLSLLPDGRALLAGGSDDFLFTEIYDPDTGRFEVGPDRAEPISGAKAKQMPQGPVMIVGGTRPYVYGEADSYRVEGEAFVSELGGFTPFAATYDVQAVVLLDLSVMVAGPSYIGDLVVLHYNGNVNLPRPTFTAPSSVRGGSQVELTGTGLTGSAAGSPGETSRRQPHAVWVPASFNGLERGPLTNWSDTSATWHVPATALAGPGVLYVEVDGSFSDGQWVSIELADAAAGCDNDRQCATGFCADGVCCDAACDGPCEACTAALKGAGVDGVCGVLPAGASTTDACSFGNGAACSSNADCASGFCTDGVCCDAACGGQCEACNVEGSFGVCVPVQGKPHGSRPDCVADDPNAVCTQSICDGNTRASCAGYVGSEVPCRLPSCADGVGVFTAGCDGAGACPAEETELCEPYVCDGNRCGDPPCTSDADCSEKFRCAIATGATVGDCVGRTDLVCDGDHTVTAPGGDTSDCSPYVCDIEGCKKSCQSTSDCIAGFACDSARQQCVATAGDSSSVEDGGCGCQLPGSGSRLPGGWVALLVAALWAVRRRETRP